MENLEKILKELLESLNKNKETECSEIKSLEIPVGISNRHIHLSLEDKEILFGKGYKLNNLKDLSQLNQFACKETLTICGAKGVIEKVRVLGPERKKTQIELSIGDCIKVGVEPQIRMSGHLDESPGITLIGPKGSICLKEGVIVAQRHIHMNHKDGKKFGVKNDELVSVEVLGLRGGVLNNVNIRLDETFTLECHIDIEEANSLGLNSKSKIQIKK